MAISAFCTVVSAVPAPQAPQAPQAGTPFRTAFHQLDSEGKVTWTPAASGGRTAQISFDDIAAVGGNTKIKQRDEKPDEEEADPPQSGVGGWTNLGKIANHAASYACQDSGGWALSSTVNSAAKIACKELEKFPHAMVVNKAWNLWEGAKLAANSEGDQAKAVFRFFYNSKEAPKLTETMCKKAMDILTESACQGKGDKGESSRGGEIKIGKDDDWLQIGFDANDV